jgi:hypothetical protein
VVVARPLKVKKWFLVFTMVGGAPSQPFTMGPFDFSFNWPLCSARRRILSTTTQRRPKSGKVSYFTALG